MGVTKEIPGTGPYRIEMINQAGENLFTDHFDLHYQVVLQEIGVLDTDKTFLSRDFPYPNETAFVQIVGANEDILLRIDPVQKLIKDKLDAIPTQCFIGSAETDRITLEQELTTHQSAYRSEQYFCGHYKAAK